MKRAWTIAAAFTTATMCGCTMLEDCPPDGVFGHDVHRFRTASHRSSLDNAPLAAQRFLLLAAMSGLAYAHEGTACSSEDDHLQPADVAKLKAVLAALPDGAEWKKYPDGATGGLPNDCQDEIGLFFRMWRRERSSGPDDVVIAFRGTSNAADWMNANLWWFTRLFISDNQYTRSSRLLQPILDGLGAQAKRDGKPEPRIVVTGHSLGGGLAQHALYDFPQIQQAVVFDPSPVTAYVASAHGKQVLHSPCDSALGIEGRIIRVYESDEILTRARIWHKIFLPTDYQMQEVRFGLDPSRSSVRAHSMVHLTLNLEKLSKEPAGPEMAGKPWYASAAQGCTRKIEAAQALACSAR